MTAARDHCLIFLHIPKTAGTSFTEAIRNEYGADHVFHVGRDKDQSYADYRSLSEVERRRIYAVTGHLAHLLEQDIPLPVRQVTFVREPLAQIASSYNFILQRPGNPQHAAVSELSGLDDYLDYLVRERRDNQQTRRLGDAVKYHETKGHTIDMQNRAQGDAVFEIAQRRLGRIDFVFVTERYDEALASLADQLRWQERAETARLNQSTPEAEFDPGTAERARAICHYDVALYEQALLRHDAMVRAN